MSDAVEAFLRKFFGAGNTIPLASVKSPETQAADWLSPWLADLSRPDRPPVLLPRRRSAQAPLEIYALAFSDEQARTLGEELNAFVGPVDTNLDRRPASLDDVD